MWPFGGCNHCWHRDGIEVEQHEMDYPRLYRRWACCLCGEDETRGFDVGAGDANKFVEQFRGEEGTE